MTFKVIQVWHKPYDAVQFRGNLLSNDKTAALLRSECDTEVKFRRHSGNENLSLTANDD